MPLISVLYWCHVSKPFLIAMVIITIYEFVDRINQFFISIKLLDILHF
jgi:hypothetical protein